MPKLIAVSVDGQERLLKTSRFAPENEAEFWELFGVTGECTKELTIIVDHEIITEIFGCLCEELRERGLII